jgi:membrane protease YdiL (CAAX protease family)
MVAETAAWTRHLSVSQRLLLLILLALIISLATAGLLKTAVEAGLPGPPWLGKLVRLRELPSGPEGPPFTYDIGRVSRRYLLLVTLAVGFTARRWAPWSSLVRRGFVGCRRPARDLCFGLGVAAVLVTVYVGMFLASGKVAWSPDPVGYVTRKVVEYLAAGGLIALVEELTFRAVLFRAMLRDWGACRALVASSALYAVLHCISGSLVTGPGWRPAIGLDLLRVYFTDARGSLLPDLRLMTGLFLLGLLLAYLYLRTGSLWASIGVHGGIIFAIKIMKKFLDRTDGFPVWLLGDYQFVVSGVACWPVLAGALLAVIWLAPRGALYRRLQRRVAC